VLDDDDDIGAVTPERFGPGSDTGRADEHGMHLSAA
jgi:hypothetical protein